MRLLEQRSRLTSLSPPPAVAGLRAGPRTRGVAYSFERRTFAAVLPLVLLLCSLPAVAAERKLAPPSKTSWVSFRNGHAQLGVAGCKLPEKLDLLWKKKTVHGVVAASAIVGDEVYAPTLNGFLFCLDRKTGEEVWKYRSIDDFDPEKFAPGMVSAPTVTADSVYVGDEDGFLHALNRATGKRRWKFQTGAKIPGGAQVVGDKVIFGSHDSFLYCVGARDGKLLWKFQTMNRINCAPAIVDGFTFVAGCDEHLRVINIRTQKETQDVNLMSYLIASPAVVGDVLYVGTYKGKVLAINWKTGKYVWEYVPPGNREPEFYASAAVTDKYVIVGARDKLLHCIDRRTGRQKWTFPTRAQINSSAVVVGDRVFFGSDDRNVYAVNIADGKQLWKYNAGAAVTAGLAVGEGCLVFGGADAGGYLYCFGKKE